MRKKGLMTKGMIMLMAVSMLTTGCAGKNGKTAIGNDAVKNASAELDEEADESGAEDKQADAKSDELVEMLKTKYQGSATDYSGNKLKIKRDEALEFEIGYNPWDNEVEASESFVVYQDAELTQPLETSAPDWNADTGVLTIEPPFYGIAEVSSSYNPELITGLQGNFVYDDEISAWGNLPQYYLAEYVDLETGKKLDKPVITVLEVESELQSAPQVKFSQTDNGEARLYWQEVPGAEEYLVFMLDKWDTGYDNYMDVVATTKNNEWICEADLSDISEDERVKSGLMNELFTQFYISEDSEAEADAEGEYDQYYQEYFGVIAVGKDGCSAVSNLMSAKDLCRLLPNSFAYNTNDEAGAYVVNGVMDLPATMGVTMCDGKTAQKVLDYDFANAVKDEENGYIEVKASVCGTLFSDVVVITEPNFETLDKDFAAITKRQDELKSKGGNVDPSISFDEGQSAEEPKKEEPAEEPKEEPEAEKPEVEEPEAEKPKKEETKGGIDLDAYITANSAISEYIARNMLETNEAIDLSGFAESVDESVVADAFFEAQYQNPLILGIKGASVDSENGILYVEYDYDEQTTAQKQDELKEKVQEVADEIISDEMSEEEKNEAINNYLCENAEYDDAALENAEKNDFYYVDEEFNDSFTAYGVLVNGVGVCASYSAAYKLLADEAGLESIVVTGYLDGSLPHAWNKVKLDGEWNIVDATNNDNELLPNVLLNLSDAAKIKALLEDDRFALDNNLYDYEAPSDTKEFYRANGNFFEKDEISTELAGKLKSDGSAVLRTDYDLDDDSFQNIAQEAANNAGKDVTGLYWMGLISLEEQ